RPLGPLGISTLMLRVNVASRALSAMLRCGPRRFATLQTGIAFAGRSGQHPRKQAMEAENGGKTHPGRLSEANPLSDRRRWRRGACIVRKGIRRPSAREA